MFNRRFVYGSLLDTASDGSGEGNGSGTENPALDKAAVEGLINNALNGFAKRQAKESEKQFGTFTSRLDEVLAKLTGSGSQSDNNHGNDGDGSGSGDEGNGAKPEKVSPAMKAKLDKMERDQRKIAEQLDTERKAREEANNRAAETERLSAIRGEMSKYPILAENVDDVYEIFKAKVKRDEDGAYVVGDTTMEAAIRLTMERMPGVLRPVDRQGSGSTPGKGKNNTALDLNDMKVGVSKETAKAYRDELIKQMQQLRG